MGSVQTLPGEVRKIIVGYLSDIDQECAHPTNLCDALRKHGLEVNTTLYDTVTRRTEIRQELAQYYDCKTDDVKKLINAITYGRRKQSTKFFEEARIPVKQHHDIITKYADAIEEIAQPIHQATMQTTSPTHKPTTRSQ